MDHVSNTCLTTSFSYICIHKYNILKYNINRLYILIKYSTANLHDVLFAVLVAIYLKITPFLYLLRCVSLALDCSGIHLHSKLCDIKTAVKSTTKCYLFYVKITCAFADNIYFIYSEECFIISMLQLFIFVFCPASEPQTSKNHNSSVTTEICKDPDTDTQ